MKRWDVLSDEQILTAYLHGSEREAAFAELVRRYERRVYGICYRYFGHPADAEDAAQDTFIAISRRASTFSGESKLSTWIYRVAVNACNDLARRRRRRPLTPVADVQTVADTPTVADHDDMVVAEETAGRLQEALLQLDDVSRMLILLVGVEGLTYPEAAAATDLPVGTVKSRVHRARARLADLLAGRDVAEPTQPPRPLTR